MIAPAPLFHARILEEHSARFAFPQDLTDRCQLFLSLLDRGPVAYEVIHSLFCGILGYLSPFDNVEMWEIDLNDRVYLGHFSNHVSSLSVRVIWDGLPDFAELEPTIDWLITLDFDHICLFYKNYGTVFGQGFSFSQFNDLDQLKLFYSIFCRRNLLGSPAQPAQARVYHLLQMTTIVEDNLCREFSRYLWHLEQKLQKDLSHRLQQLAIGVEGTEKRITRLILYRLILLQGMTDRGLLPKNLLQDAYNFVNPYINQPVWTNYRALFRWMVEGNPSQSITPKAIEFFNTDDVLDRSIHIGDELCRQMKEICQFDLKDDIYPVLLSFLLACHFSGKRTNFRKWRTHKLLYQAAQTWNYLWSLNIQNPEEAHFFDPQVGIGLRLLLAFVFLKMLYKKKYPQAVPPDREIICQLSGIDRDERKVEITKLVFYLSFGSAPPTKTREDKPVINLLEQIN